MKINILDKLFVGFYAYGRNFYKKEKSLDYGANLLATCLIIIYIPIGVFLSIILSEKLGITDSSAKWMATSGIAIIYLFPLFFYVLGSRGKKVIEYFKTKEFSEIKKLKRNAGYTAILSFVWFTIMLVVGFIFSQK
jgi:hypothetical protein